MVDFGADLDPFWGSKTEQEELQEEPKSSQDEVAVENAAKSKICVSLRRELMFWVLEWPKTSPAEAKDAILQAKSLQKRGSKNETKKITKNDGEGTNKAPKSGNQKSSKNGVKNGP